MALLYLHRLDDARAAAEEACERGPDNAWNLMRLAEVVASQDVVEAAEIASRAVASGPANPETYRVLSNVCMRRPAKDDPRSALEARAALEARGKAMELAPGHAADHWVKADALRSLGRHVEAASEYRTALEIDPTAHEPMNNFGLLHLRRRPIRAASLFRESARLDPTCPNPRRGLTQAIHASLFRFTWILLLSGLGLFALHLWLPSKADDAVLVAPAFVGLAGGAMLWRTLPPGTRREACLRHWRVGLVFAIIALVVIGTDIAIALEPRLDVWCAALLITIGASCQLLPRTPLAPVIRKRLGGWLVP